MTPSFFLLMDDIAAILDDVALLSKVAAKKTAGVLGDDLALNALQVSGVSPDRELPVVWAVGKGSLVNKAILAPTALALSAWAPVAIKPLLVIGGLYLCFEGAEKIVEKVFHKKHQAEEPINKLLERQKLSAIEILELEKEKIKGAIRTDFILSAEIIVIALGTVSDAPFIQQVWTLIAISIAMTLGVYGLVAAIVKIDDLGLFLLKSPKALVKKLGSSLLIFAPLLMKFLSAAGTAAMFTVGGGILIHATPEIAERLETFNPGLKILGELIFGFASGLIVVAGLQLVKKIKAVWAS